MTDIMNGRYALADPGSGLTVLSLEGGELNMFGRCTRIRTTQRDFYPQIQDEPTELKVENNIVAQLATGLVVAAALAAVAVAVVVTGGAALAPLACALGGAAIGVGAVAIGTAVNDSETGCNRSWEDYWEELITGSCIGFMAGASIYGIVAAVPAAAGAAATMFGTSVFTSTAAHVIATVGGYGLAAASGLYTANDIYSNSRGYNAILDKIFDNDIEAYETVGMVLDLFGEMYVSLGESNRALGNRSGNADGETGEAQPKKSVGTGANEGAGAETSDGDAPHIKIKDKNSRQDVPETDAQGEPKAQKYSYKGDDAIDDKGNKKSSVNLDKGEENTAGNSFRDIEAGESEKERNNNKGADTEGIVIEQGNDYGSIGECCKEKGITLPNAQNAIIDPKKLTEYALNPDHPVGGNKAKVFERALGYNRSNADDLINQIYEKLPDCNAELGKLDEYGQRYTVDIPITGPNGKTVNVRTGWIIKIGSDIPNLTTLFVK